MTVDLPREPDPATVMPAAPGSGRANLAQPFRVMREATTAGHEAPAVSSRMLGWWWASFLAPIVVSVPSLVGLLADADYLTDGRLIVSLSWARQARVTGAAGGVATIAATTLAWIIVRAITQRTVRTVNEFVPARPDLT
jgi:hypothetical protein